MSAVLKRNHSGLMILHKVWKVLNQALPLDFHKPMTFLPILVQRELFHAPLFPYCVPNLLMPYCQIKELNWE